MSKYFRLERIDHLNVKIKLSLTFISNQSCWWGVAHSQAADWPRSLLVFDKAGLLALGPWAQTLWSTSSPNKSSTQSWPVKASELSEVNFTLEGLSTHIYRPLKKQFELSSCSDYSVTLQLFSEFIIINLVAICCCCLCRMILDQVQTNLNSLLFEIL